jgi:hypothetical protein
MSRESHARRRWLVAAGAPLAFCNAVEFPGIPAGPGTQAGVKGAWSVADARAVIKARMR